MNWEIELLQNLQNIRNPFLTAIMEAFSFMAESLFLVIIVATLYWCIDKKKMVRLAWLVLVSGVTNGILKNIIKAPRPFQKGVVSPLRVETATSYSFPSGHTQGATTFWLGTASLFKNKSILAMGIVMILLTGVSRMYLGVHWPMDVIGGIITGILTLLVADLLYDESKGFKKAHVLGVSILVVLAIIFPIEEDLTSAVGALWGFVTGVYMEQNYIKFNVGGDWKVQLKKILLGFGVTLVVYIGFEKMIGTNPLLEMIRHAIVLLWISAGAPYIFKKFWGTIKR